MAYVVGVKGQVVISKDIRERLGIEAGWIALQRLVGDHLEVYFIPPEHKKSLKGALATHIRAHIAPGKDWNRARERAWNKAAERKAGERKRAS